MIHRLMHIKVVCYVDISHAQKSSGGGGIYIDVDFYAMSSWCKDTAWARAYAPTDPVADVDDEELSGSSVRALPFFLLLSFFYPPGGFLFIHLTAVARWILLEPTARESIQRIGFARIMMASIIASRFANIQRLCIREKVVIATHLVFRGRRFLPTSNDDDRRVDRV